VPSQQPPPTSEEEENPLRGDARYAAYLARARAILVAGKTTLIKGSRYLAYSSDVGESFRPVLPGWAVGACYGVAFAYVGADVAWVGYKASQDGKTSTEVARAATQEFTFQGIASLALPTVIIHTAVHQSQKLFVKSVNATLARWGPCFVGLSLIPLMPYLDEPCEHGIEMFFDAVWPTKDGGHHDGEHDKHGSAQTPAETVRAEADVRAQVAAENTGAQKEALEKALAEQKAAREAKEKADAEESKAAEEAAAATRKAAQVKAAEMRENALAAAAKQAVTEKAEIEKTKAEVAAKEAAAKANTVIALGVVGVVGMTMLGGVKPK